VQDLLPGEPRKARKSSTNYLRPSATGLSTFCKPACRPSASTTKETKEETKEETKALAVPSSQEPEELEPDELELEPPVGFKGNIEDLIYNAYPRKTAKPSARKAIGKPSFAFVERRIPGCGC